LHVSGLLLVPVLFPQLDRERDCEVNRLRRVLIQDVTRIGSGVAEEARHLSDIQVLLHLEQHVPRSLVTEHLA
jgi:hypothetical protein